MALFGQLTKPVKELPLIDVSNPDIVMELLEELAITVSTSQWIKEHEPYHPEASDIHDQANDVYADLLGIFQGKVHDKRINRKVRWAGKAMRAVSEDMGAARLMGINVNSTISFTFAVGSALAGIGAVLYAMAYTQASPTMGMMLGTKAFVAAVLGGIGSIPGAVVGGLLVGFAEVIVTALGLSVWKDAVVFLLLIIVLVVRPTGIFGRTMNEKV